MTATVAREFGRGASSYDALAAVQQASSALLVEAMLQHVPEASGHFLEVGCGTGGLTQPLIEAFPAVTLEAWDIAPGMLEVCRERCKDPRLTLYLKDGHDLLPQADLDGVVSNYALQWLGSPGTTLDRWMRSLRRGGSLHLAFPTRQSFPEWREVCEASGTRCTLNPLPDPVALLPPAGEAQVLYSFEASHRLRFESALEFFGSLKGIGANTALSGTGPDPRNLRRLVRAWDALAPTGVEITYVTHFLGLLQSKRP